MSVSLATNILKNLETSSSLGMFARDTGGCLISRLALSRSKDESREISIAEISESALFYFSAPALAKLSAKFFREKYSLSKDIFTKSINELQDLDRRTLKKVKLGKLGQILTTFGIILPAIFAIAPVRNMITLADSGKEKFTSVINLDKEKGNDSKKYQAKQKASSLIKKLASIALLSLGATAGLLSAAKKNKTYKIMEPALDKFLKHFDFSASGDLELAHYAALIYPVSIASYFYSCRDKYEVKENARRFSITVPLMLRGEKLIQNPIHKFFDNKYNTSVMSEKGIMSYKDIFNLPKEIQEQFLKTKNRAYGLTFFINTMFIAGAVALLNRIKTKENYKKEKGKSNG